jgi:poly(A) polymerase
MRTDLPGNLVRQFEEKTDPAWLLRTGRLFAEEPERFLTLREHPAYAELRDAAREQCEKRGAVSLPPAALREGLQAIIMTSGAPAGLQWLHESGALAAFLPELDATVNFSQEAGRRHKDVWEHTKQVVWQADPRPAVRWAALLHDIGKVKTRSFTPDGKVTFHHHSEVGARMFDEIGQRLGFDTGMRRTLRFLILHHLRPNQYLESWTDSAVRRFTREMGGYLPDLLDLSRADITSRRPGRRQQALVNIDALSQRLETLRAEDAVLPLLPTGIGNLIMEHFRLPPSRLIGDLKRKLEAAIEAGELEARMDSSAYIPYVEKLLEEAPKEPHLCQE